MFNIFNRKGKTDYRITVDSPAPRPPPKLKSSARARTPNAQNAAHKVNPSLPTKADKRHQPSIDDDMLVFIAERLAARLTPLSGTVQRQ